MIHVQKDFSNPPAALTRKEIRDSLKKILAGDKKAMSSDLYRGKTETPEGIIFEVVETLKLLYHSKCGYCESKEFDPQVEHYRPKNRVTRAKGHKGYYWLVYEWINLLPTCFDCNKIGPGKGNHFPLMDEQLRIISPPDNQLNINDLFTVLVNEKPLLLHPEIDEHAPDCFPFSNKGRIKGIDGEGRGKATISICNLNRRNLQYRRKKIFDVFIDRIKDILYAFSSKQLPNKEFLKFMKLTFLKMQKWSSPKEEYSLFGRYSLQNFDKLILPRLPKKYRLVVGEAFHRFKRGEL